ncbi:hypothetical protein GIB67_011721, partial [Kingdonia uniflora]
YEYRWADGVLIKKPIEVYAPKYMEYLMDWIESQLDDEYTFYLREREEEEKLLKFELGFDLGLTVKAAVFETLRGAPFPSNYREVVKTIFKRLFRVYAHIYHSHFQKIVSGGGSSQYLLQAFHIVPMCKLFYIFFPLQLNNEFDLIDKELAPLQELIESIIVPY